MKSMIRVAIGSVVLMAGLAVSGASRADAQVSFQGVFPLPHGTISVAIGDPAFQVGAYVPFGYQVAARPGYGYGFGFHDHWIPVRRYGAQWIVCDRPYGVDYAYAPVVYPPPVYYPYGYAYRGTTHGYAHGYSAHGHDYGGHGNQGNHGNHGHHGNQGNHGDHGNHGHARH